MTTQKQQDAEQALALLALAAQAPKPFSGTAPSDEEMADFIDGRIQGQRREEILAYLCANPEAYREWQDTLDALAAIPAPAKPAAKAGMGERIRAWLASWQSFRLAWAGAAAMAVLVALVVIPQIVPTPTGMEAGYRMLAERGVDLSKILAQKNATQSVPRAFAPTDPPYKNAQRAFSSGVRQGQQYLLNHAPLAIPREWASAPWKAYAELGEWTLLTWTAAQADQALPQEFWQAQMVLLNNLQVVLDKQKNTVDLSGDLEKIQNALQSQPLPAYQKLLALSATLLKQMNVENAP